MNSESDIEQATIRSKRTAADQALLNEVAEHYERQLAHKPELLAPLHWRGLVGGELRAHFRLGCSRDRLLASLAPGDSAEAMEVRARLRALGLIKPSGLEWFSGALVVPILDAAGNVLQLFGGYHSKQHSTDPDLYLPGPRRGVIHVRAFEEGDELIVCETPIDVLRFWYAGHVNATSSYGSVGLVEEQLAAIKAHAIRRVLLAYSPAPENDRPVQRLAEKLQKEGLHVYRIALSRRFKATSPGWSKLIREAVPLGDAPPRPLLATPRPPDWQRLPKKEAPR